ncbi:MAG: ATP-binding protein [Polyangiaceae bacterium]|nr:ATP-binding protein [Polyangiaceae bacterium]
MKEPLLKAATARLLSVIQHMNLAILVEDEDRKIALVNQNFCDLFRISAAPEALVGQDCNRAMERVLPALAEPQQFLMRVHELLSHLQPAHRDAVVMMDGRTLERDYIPIFEGDRFMGHLWHYRDVTERQRHEEELERAAEDARQTMAAKDAFIAAVSHELRSPLHAVIGGTELLRERTAEPGSRELIQAVLQSARGLLGLIDDILDLSSLRAGAFALRPAPCDLLALLQELLASFRATAEARGLQLDLRLLTPLPPAVQADRQRLAQVLTNLIANALRFTDRGRVELRAQGALLEGGRCRLRFEVIDTGLGVSPADRPHLFRPFQQALDAQRRRGGTGLGLAISHQLILQMDGSIGHEPNPEGGSCFWFEVPLPILDAPVARMMSTVSIPAPRQQPRRILVIEDNPANRVWARHALTSRGYEVVLAEGGPQALDLLRSDPAFDAILTDWQMPILDGLETTRAIRAMGGDFASMPILGLSASALSDAEERCREAGMDGCLLKPVSIRTLADTLESLLAQKAHARAAPVILPHTTLPPSRGVQVEGLPPEICLELAELFLEHVTERCSLLEQAVAAQDREAIARNAHSIASSASGVQQLSLAEHARSIEAQALQQAPFAVLTERSHELIDQCLRVAPVLVADTRLACGLQPEPLA